MARERKAAIPCGGNLVGRQRVGPIARDSVQSRRRLRFGRFASVAANRSVDHLVAHVESQGAGALHTIRLALLNPALHPERLDSGYYARSVEIIDV